METMDDTDGPAAAETPTPAGEIQAQTPGPDDIKAMRQVDNVAFGVTPAPDEPTPWAETYSQPYAQVAVCDGQVVGAAGAFEMSLTLPGAVTVECPGVTGVSVLPTHRRRGALNKMMWRQLAEFRRGGAIIVALTASEGGIYERYGYGIASDFAAIEIDTSRAFFRVDQGPGSFQMVPPSEAATLLPALHSAKAGVRHGMTSRPTELWDAFFADHESARTGRSGLFHVAHLDESGDADGYVSYRVTENAGPDGIDNVVHVEQVVGLRPSIELDLWRFVCSLDLATTVRGLASPGDPLRHALTDPRALRTTAVRDHLWTRIIDLAAVLGTRRYEHDGELVIGAVDWEFTNNTGQFRLTIEGGTATIARTQDKPDATADIATWSALALGGRDATDMAVSGRLQGNATAVNRFLRTSHLPWCDVDF